MENINREESLPKSNQARPPGLSTVGAHNKCVLAAFFIANRSHPFLVVFREGIPHPSSSSLGKSHVLMDKIQLLIGKSGKSTILKPIEVPKFPGSYWK